MNRLLGKIFLNWLCRSSLVLKEDLHLLKILLFYGIGVDTRKLKGKRETKGHLQKDCCKRERQRGVEELKFGQGGSTWQGGLGGQCDSLMHLLAQRAMMMMMMIMMKMKVLIEFFFLTGTFLWICWEQYSTTYSCRGNREVQPEGFSRA